MIPSLSIDVFSDVVCPWCFIGSVRLEQAIRGLQGELSADVCLHPFFLDPQLPPEGISVPDTLRKRYGVEPQQLWRRAEEAARQSGLALDLSLQPRMYRTERAHTLLRHAQPKGTQLALAAALFRAYFQDARNIDDEQVLAELAQAHGFERAEALALVASPVELELTRDEALAAARGGVRGVPLFVFGGGLAVSGAQSVGVLQAAMRRALQEQPDAVSPAT